MKPKKGLFARLLTLVATLVLLTPSLAFAEGEEAVVPAPEGFMALVVVVPLILIIVLLILKFDMLVAGLAGGVLAMVVGGVGLATAQTEFVGGIQSMLSNTVPIVNSAVATAVFMAGGYTAALTLVRRAVKEQTWIMAAFIVILQAAATYMSGIGGGSAMVIAPLAFAALGAIPELIAGMSIATAVCFTTSPASLETSVVSQLTGAEVGAYVSTMQVFTVLFVAVGVAVAIYGAIKNKGVFTGAIDEKFEGMSTGQLAKMTVPAVFLLFSVIVGPQINAAFGGVPVLGAFVYTIVTIALVFLCTDFNLKQSCDALIKGSEYILTRLFGIGIFLCFINLISATGAFTVIVNFASGAPAFLLVPAMVIAGVAIGFPAGAYVGSILGLILPIAIGLDFSLLEIGFVTVGVAFGSQISYVNITMQALSSGFQIPIDQVVKGNLRWVGIAAAILVVLSAVL